MIRSKQRRDKKIADRKIILHTQKKSNGQKISADEIRRGAHAAQVWPGRGKRRREEKRGEKGKKRLLCTLELRVVCVVLQQHQARLWPRSGEARKHTEPSLQVYHSGQTWSVAGIYGSRNTVVLLQISAAN